MTQQREQQERACARVQLGMGLPAELRLRGTARAEPFAATVIDLGPDGAFVATERTLPVGAEVEVRFALDSHPLPFELAATVRWTRAGGADGQAAGLGLQFHALVEYDRSALVDYCLRRLEERRRL